MHKPRFLRIVTGFLDLINFTLKTISLAKCRSAMALHCHSFYSVLLPFIAGKEQHGGF